MPATLQKQLLQMAHTGHPRIVRMKRKLRESYWWPGMDNAVTEFIRHCTSCQDSAKSAPRHHIPDTRVPEPTTAWHKLAIDITGPFSNAPPHMSNIVVVIDYFTKFPEILCTSDITAPRIIKWLKELFARYGCPDRIVSDNGPQFTSHEWQAFMKSNDIQQDRTPVYHPQRNGLVEVFNRYLKHGVQTFKSSHYQWTEGLHHLLFQFRCTAPTPDGKSPAELMFSRKARMPFEVNRSKQGGERDAGEKAFTASQEEPKHQFIHRGPFKVGQRVRVQLPHVLKGQSPFSKPLTVTEALGKWTYKLSDGQVWHAKRMRHINEQTMNLAPTQFEDEQPPPVPEQPPPVLKRSGRRNKGIPPERFTPG